MTPIDVTLGLNAQAVAVLHAVAGRACDLDEQDAIFNTAAWYNSRERGVVVTKVDYGANARLHVAWAEHRSSDTVVVYSWRSKVTSINPPGADDVPDEVWGGEGVTHFPYLRLDLVVDHVVALLKGEALMDPDANLRELRDLMDTQDYVWTEEEQDRVRELFEALDNWLKRGGFLPQDWRRP